MRDLGLRKCLYLSLVSAFFIILLCFLLFHYSEPVRRDDPRRILLKSPTQHSSEREELVQVLRRATMPDRTVIITMVDEAWASPGSILDLFLQSFRDGQDTRRFLSHLVIITMDSQAFEYCRSLHPYCIHPSILSHYFGFIAPQSTPTLHHSLFSWKRNYLLLKVLELGYNIIYTDVDVMWLRSPLSHFHTLKELSISCDFSSYEQRGGNVQDGGLFYLKASVASLEFFKLWNVRKVQYPNSQVDKSFCMNIMKSRDAIEAYGVRIQYVSATYFGGFCQLNKDKFSEAYSMHANCCEELRSKVHDLKLVLDDWINFRSHSSKNYTALRLRAPQKCLR
ncbi:nucleotide-diphospho-sugar transferase family protein [Senna tora]|uniref:Nucleotide-diphospho-sugar transferase family protein n=1 Tax=Senna tora TaxID=362788 RepID=A0A834TDZ5_9FABA|nr:nucleotide-diphospho-sugar transferase family protein [Senna tora]